MNLYLLRHGDAEPSAATDAARGLTTKGKKETGDVINWFREKTPKIKLILCSHYLRAHQTAEIVKEILQVESPIRSTEALLPESSPKEILTLLEKMVEEDILLVGHLPHLGLLVGKLVWGKDNTEVSIKKSGLISLTLPGITPGKATLNWSVSPEKLRSV